jgi:hypothetical protein
VGVDARARTVRTRFPCGGRGRLRPLSARTLKEMRHEHDMSGDRSTLPRWGIRDVLEIEQQFRPHTRPVGQSWRLDETSGNCSRVFQKSGILRSIMMLPAIEALGNLSRTELIALVKQLSGAVQQLQAQVARLEADLVRGHQPPATSRNSSQPPSRDQKANPLSKRRRQRGARPGHTRAVRALVETPDQVLGAPVRQCGRCQADLRRVAPCAVVRRQITELPEIRPVVIETRRQAVVCPAWQHVERGVLPPGLGARRVFGPRLEATVVYLKHEQHLSYERLTQLCHDLFGVAVSEGGATAILQRAGAAAQPAAAAIGAQVCRSPVMGSDGPSAGCVTALARN